MRTFTVNLGDRSYPIHLGAGIARRLPAMLRQRFPRSRFIFVTDQTVARVHAQPLSAWRATLDADACIIPPGERFKTLRTWSRILDRFFAARLERTSVAIAFGGGVVGDMTGFAAASFLRGIPYVQVPTTLLAMVDSAVGGKTAVNHAAGKNLVGAFHQPSLVLADTEFLATLPPREFIAGFAELYKYAFIGGPGMFDFVRRSCERILARDRRALIQGIERSLRIKAAIVSRDEREGGVRALLNFGHTFAHAVENYFHYRGVLHGEAVLWGIACACDLGRRIGTIPRAALPAYDDILRQCLRRRLPQKPEPQRLMRAMFTDKKVRYGMLRFVLPTQPGKASVCDGVPKKAVQETLRAVFG